MITIIHVHHHEVVHVTRARFIIIEGPTDAVAPRQELLSTGDRAVLKLSRMPTEAKEQLGFKT